MVVCDKWTVLKIFEVLFCIACLVCKRVTDDESVRLALYLQKLSREWSLLRNITWDAVGAAFGDAVYGGYVIITFGLLLGRMFKEIPNGRRIIEGFLLGIGALFFIVLGGLELASLDSVPSGLIDNAAVLGVLSLVTAALFLIDLAGPRSIPRGKEVQPDAERNLFVYPNLPRIERVEDNSNKNNAPANTNGHTDPKRPTFFPEKFTKQDKKSKLDPLKMDHPPTQRGQDNAAHDHNDDSFLSGERDGYRQFPEANTDGVFETMEKSKYGSVRNGDVKRPELVDVKSRLTQKADKEEETDGHNSLDDVIRSLREHEQEMERNVSYLKMLDDRRKHDRSEFEEDLAKLNEEYMRNFHKDRVTKLNEANRVLPKMGLTRTEYEKWEKFEDESIPKFPVKESYLPELQTPIFSRIKEKSTTKSYGVYDNVSLYNIHAKTDSGSQTDTLKSKASTLRASKPPTLQQIAEYFGLPHKPQSKKEASVQMDNTDMPAVSFVLPMDKSKKEDENINYNGGPSSPTDPGYVQYAAQQWNDRAVRKYSTRTPRHSPTET